MVHLFLICTFFGSLSGVSHRESLLKQLSALEKHPRILESLVETVDTAQHTVASGNSRRRVYIDQDCDNLVAHSDEIEDHCSSYRYGVLVSIEGNYTSMLQKNGTQSDRMSNLDLVMNGDPSRSGELNGILRTMYLQRIAVYGGLEPVSNSQIPGFYQNFETMRKGELLLHSRSVASLDSLWNATLSTDAAVADILYNQVFKYATLTEKLMKMMGSAGEDVLNHDVGEIEVAANETNAVLAQISATICAAQRELATQGKNATDLSDSTISVVSAAVDKLLSRSDDFLNLLDQKRSEGDQVIDSVTSGSENIISSGIDSINIIADSYLRTFTESLEKMMAAFDGAADGNLTVYKTSLDRMLTNETARIQSTIDSELDIVHSKRDGVQKQIDDLHNRLMLQTAKVRAYMSGNYSMAEDKLAAQKDNATLTLSGMQESLRSITMQTDDANQRVDPLSSNLRSQLGQQVQSAASASQTNIQGAISAIEQARQEMMGAVSASQTSVQETIQQSSSGIGQGAVNVNQLASDQTGAISSARSVGQAKILAVSDAAESVLTSNLKPLMQSVGNSAADTVTLASQISLAQQSANSDTIAAIKSGQSANSAQLNAANVAGIAASANATNQLAQQMTIASSGIEDARHVLGNAQSHLSNQDSSLAVIYATGTNLDDQTRKGLSSVESGIASLNDGFADSLGSSVQSNLQQTVGRIQDISNKSQSEAFAKSAALRDQLESMINVLRNAQADSVGTISPEMRIMSQMLEDIQSSLSDLEDREESTVQGFNQTLWKVSSKYSGSYPRDIQQKADKVDALRAGVAGKLDQILGKAQQTISARVDSVSTKWSDAVSVDYLRELAEMAASIPVIVQSVNDSIARGSKFTGDMKARVDGLTTAVGNVERKTSRSLVDFERNLTGFINVTSDGFLKTLSMSPEDIARAYLDASKNVSASITGAAEDTVNAMVEGSKQRLVGQLDAEIRKDASQANLIDSVLRNVTSDLNSMAAARNSEFADGQNQVLSASEFVKEAMRLARVIASNISTFEVMATKQMDDAVDRAYALNDKIDSAVGWEGKLIEQQLAKGGANLKFQTTSDGVTALQLTNSSEQSVGDALAAVGSFKDALNLMLDDSNKNSDGTHAMVSTAGGDIESAFGAVQGGARNHHESLNASLTIEQMIDKLKIAKIREFTKNVRDGWLRYVDYEADKFQQMSDADRANFANMQAIVNNGLESGNAKIGSTNTSVAIVQDSLNTALVNFTSFQGGFDSEAAGVQTAIGNLFSNATGDNSTIVEMISSEESSMNTTDANDRASIEAKLGDFEASLDDISNRVLQSVS